METQPGGRTDKSARGREEDNPAGGRRLSRVGGWWRRVEKKVVKRKT